LDFLAKNGYSRRRQQSESDAIALDPQDDHLNVVAYVDAFVFAAG
jgi:hypothetical protein